MSEPFTPHIKSTREPISSDRLRRASHRLVQLPRQRIRDPFIGIQHQYPFIFRRTVIQRPVSLRPESFERVHKYLRAMFLGNLHGAIPAAWIDDDNIVAPGYTGNTGFNMYFFVEREYHHADRHGFHYLIHHHRGMCMLIQTSLLSAVTSFS